MTEIPFKQTKNKQNKKKNKSEQAEMLYNVHILYLNVCLSSLYLLLLLERTLVQQ
jgi:hypothetical protein